MEASDHPAADGPAPDGAAQGEVPPRLGDFPQLDNEVTEEMNLIVDSDGPGPSKTKRGIGGAVLAASMFGLAEVIEPSKVDVEMEQVVDADDPQDDPLAGLDFGSLPPLN